MSQCMLYVEESKEEYLKGQHGDGHLLLLVDVIKDTHAREKINKAAHEGGICERRIVANRRQITKRR